ncbi:MAG: acyl-CoA dehydrogenase, partial [Proteobacteria bacterium]|nr:acyl-CoA dehydrogenase [Pseudomonadota bacterium]
THAIIGVSRRQESLLPRVAEGQLIPVAAIDEAETASRLTPTTTLTHTDGSWHLSGAKHWISAGASATHLTVLAQSEDGLAWVLVPTTADGVECDSFPTHDGRGGMNCRFDLVLDADHILLQGQPATDALEAYRALAMTLSSAETLGATQAALDTTVDYTKQRVQFGQPLASFQALQHRMSNMLIQTELTRSLIYAACNASDSGHDDAARFARAAKVKAATVGRKVSQEAIQLHGGIATTDEYIVGHFFKRITALESWVCSKGEALKEFMALSPS